MNRTKIGWVVNPDGTPGFTWNVQTGCLGPGGSVKQPRRCPWCYAWRLAKGRLKPLYTSNYSGALRGGRVGSHSDPFWPRFWAWRLFEPWERKKPAGIFVCSMGELFGDWVPLDWIQNVLDIVERSPQHRFYFLTKNPARYKELEPWPDNCWLGTTVTNQRDLVARWTALREVRAKVRFLSVEPMLGRLRWPLAAGSPHWVIMGALTGPGGKQPKREWVDGLTAWCECLGVPVFHKDNIDCEGLGIQRRREWPR